MTNYDITDYIVSGDVEKVASVAGECSPEAGQAYIPSLEDNAKADPSDFGVCIYHPRHGFMSKYATHSKELTELNLAILKSQVDEIPDEIIKVASTNLQKAAAHYKLDFPEELGSYIIETPLENNIVHIENIDKTAFYVKTAKEEKIEHVYALPKNKKYPITNKELIKVAEEYFGVYHKDLSIGDRIDFAVNITNEMTKHGMEPGKLIEKLANLDHTKLNHDFKYHIKSRQDLTHDEDLKGLYGELLEKSAEWPLTKVASVLNKLDGEAKITYFYNKNISDPVESTFEFNKEAEYEIDGRVWKDSDFNKIASLNLSKYIDPNTIEDLAGDSRLKVYKALPKPIRDAIANEIL